jgi:hypothetical protein
MKGKPDDIAVNAVLRRCRMALLAFVALSVTACMHVVGEWDWFQEGNPFDDAIRQQPSGNAAGIVQHLRKDIERRLAGRRDVETVYDLLTAYDASCEWAPRLTVCQYNKHIDRGVWGGFTMLHYEIEVTARAGPGPILVLKVCAHSSGDACTSTTLT